MEATVATAAFLIITEVMRMIRSYESTRPNGRVGGDEKNKDQY